MKRFLKLIALTLALAVLPVMALAETGSAAVTEGTTYTLEEMLTYAMQDEYMAEAEYAAIRAAFGVNNPFANIQNAEVTHQAELLPLFAAYGIPVPANTAAGNVVIPATLEETYEIGVQAEIANIAMYQAFLAQDGVPQDVRDVFTAFINASQSHLQAFTRNAEKTGIGLGNGRENGLNSKDVNGYGQGYGSTAANTQLSGRGMVNNAQLNENCDDCEYCETPQTRQPRGGRNAR